jgi:hypothetical protein
MSSVFMKKSETFFPSFKGMGTEASLLFQGGGSFLAKGSFYELAEGWSHEVIFSLMGNPNFIKFDPPLRSKTGGGHLRFNLRRGDQGTAKRT